MNTLCRASETSANWMPSRRGKGASILPRRAGQRKIRGTPEGQGLLGKLLIVDFRLLIEKQRLIALHK
jgi:hypothetical protein